MAAELGNKVNRSNLAIKPNDYSSLQGGLAMTMFYLPIINHTLLRATKNRIARMLEDVAEQAGCSALWFY